ncbi:MAG: pyruvate dehydrogenase complex dihydrolipoamide acetyltransferase [Candidatus Puniceispirillales bacterium]
MAFVTMPALSPTMTEGTLSRWLVKEGDEVRSGDVIAEIETDKALMEVEALDDGKVSRIMVAEGSENVAVGAAIAEILAEGEEAGDLPVAPVAPAAAEPPAAAPDPAHEPASAPAPVTQSPAAASPASGRIIASPLAKRLAAENSIDLSLIKGSGPHGRIVLADIKTLVEGGGTAAAPLTPLRATTVSQAPAAAGEASSLIENSPMRMVIADRLQQSMQEAPHFYVSMDICLDPLLEARKALNEAAPEGVRLSVNDMIIKAAAMTLMRHPEVNASWEGQHTRRHHHADIAVAVALEEGLVTPIVAGAEAKGLYAISTEMKDLAERARSGRLKTHEITGGSFTISNLGPYGVSAFTAVINPPHAAILAIAAGEQRAVVRDGELAVATMMTATLSCDHRVVDGATGAEWMAGFKALIENPVLALA